jgi:hypothetical protein
MPRMVRRGQGADRLEDAQRLHDHGTACPVSPGARAAGPGVKVALQHEELDFFIRAGADDRRAFAMWN